MTTQSNLASQVEKLSDIELAVLLCLVASQHCIIESDPESQHPLSEELQLVRSSNPTILLILMVILKIAANCFGLSAAVVQCSPSTTLEAFGDGILVNDDLAGKPSALRSVGVSLMRDNNF